MATFRCSGESISKSTRARRSASSARTAPARARCCARCPACCDRARAPSHSGAKSSPTEGRRLFGPMNVIDNLLTGAYLRSDKAAVRRDLDRMLTLFPILAERRFQAAGTLSGGEQQMCAIARGIMSAPKLLMIDELSLGLAPKVVDHLSTA